MKIYYENCLKEKVDLTSADYNMLRNTDLFDYEWNYSTRNEYNPEIYLFSRSMVEKKMTISIHSAKKEQYKKLQNKLLEVFEKDVYYKKQGKLIVGDYYLPCYVIGKTINAWYEGANIIRNDFKIVSERGRWYKDVFKNFNEQEEQDSKYDGKMHPYDFKFDFSNPSMQNRLASDSFVPFDFELTVQGACVNPSVSVGDNLYRVFVELGQNDYISINSKDKTVIVYREDGITENVFYLRDRDNYIFEKMPSENGMSYVKINNENVAVSIRAFVERSEPKWT